MRLFVGAYPPPEVVADLAAFVAGLELGRPQPAGHSLRVVAPDRWHLTLAFLGEIPDGRVGAVMNALQAMPGASIAGGSVPDGSVPDGSVARGSVPGASIVRGSMPDGPVSRGSVAGGPVRLRVAGGGKFGRSRFTTVWAGLDGELDRLRGLAAAIRRELKRARLPFDAKPFRPHITLARPGDRLPAETVARDLATLQGYRGPEWTVTDVRLVRSFLGPEPRYETLAAVAA